MIGYPIDALAFAPSIFEGLIKHIEPSRLDEGSGPDRFSPREVVAHLADWEPIFLSRIQTAVDTPGSSIMVFDEGELAKEHNYASQDLDECLARFRRGRHQTVAYLQGLSPDQFRRTVVHPERGVMSVDDLIGYLFGHDAYHVEQLVAHLGPRVAGTW